MKAKEFSKLVSSTEIYHTSLIADVITLLTWRGKIEVRIDTVHKESEVTTEVIRFKLDLKEARRLRAMLDIHIKSFVE